MLTWYERVFINTCNLFGMKIFKKYWPAGGSFWNETHINPKNRIDLENVIRDSWIYTRLHVGLSFGIGYMLTWRYFLGDGETMKSLFPLYVWEIYAFSAHIYNRILAKEALINLPKENVLMYKSEDSSKLLDELNKVNKDNILKVTSYYIYDTKQSLYYVCVNFKRLGKYFETIEEAVEFRKSLYDKYGDKHITYLNLDL